MQHHKLITSYYIIGALLLGAQVLYTVFQGSLMVNYGQKVAHLEQQKATHLHQRQLIQQQLNQTASLLSIQQSSDYTQFHPIAQVVKVTNNTAVALR